MCYRKIVDYGFRELGLRPEKIFNVSLHRTATHSFHLMCQRHGIRSQHWPGFGFDVPCSGALADLNHELVWNLYRPFVNNNDALSDLPAPLIFPQAARDCHGARFLLISRPVEGWINSIRRHTTGRELDSMEKLQYWNICRHRHDCLSEYSDDELAEGYRNHDNMVRTSMLEHSAAFRAFDLGTPDLGNRIAEYCGFSDRYAVF